MKVKILTWEQLQEQDPKQTAVIVTYTSPKLEELKVPLKRVILGDFYSREEAWNWCRKENVKRKIIYEKGEAVQIDVALLRLAKVVREFTETKPGNAYAMKLV